MTVHDVCMQVQPHLGSLLLSPADGQTPAIDWLLQDRLVVLVLELLASPTAAGADDSTTAPVVEEVLVGRTVLAPFAEVAADGSSAVLDEGRHSLCFDSSSCLGNSGSSSSCWALKGCSLGMLAAGSSAVDLLLPLNWRALLGDTAARAVPDATLDLDLQPCSSPPQLPVQLVAVAAAAPSICPGGMQPSSAAAEAVQHTASSSMHHATGPHPAAAPPGTPAPPAVQDAVTATRLGSAVAAQQPPAATSLVLAAQHLEAAASIPVQVRRIAGS